MHHSLSLHAKFALCIALSVSVVGGSFPLLEAVAAPAAQPVAPLHLDVTELELPSAPNQTASLKLAHNGDGCEAASGALGSAVTSAQMMSLNGHATHVAASDSLWGNLLLSMAYQRDAEIQQYARKLTRVNNLTMLSIVGVSGLGLAQSIIGYNNLSKGETLEVGHDGHEEHLHTQADSKATSVMSIVGSGATLATIGFQRLMNRKYSHKISDRQNVLKGRVEHILGHLKEGEAFSSVESDLVDLVGPIATQEFSELWRATHPSIDVPNVSENHSHAGENESETGLN